ncbi:response regulator transcription factor [Micropruina sp.]|uniref:response regulator n=1 Tax=Micropruina sp. TaxID=2737536 RepID=UPI0026245922|nr:response regulator transcription factor [Micropruina sp.]
MSVRKQIGIVDDHPAVVIGVTSVINTHPSLFVSGAGATLTELLRQSTQYDLVLLDLTLGDGSTPTTNVRSLVSRGIPVLVYTSGDQPQLIREAVRAGAMGMVRKSEFPQRIVAAIIEVLRGQVAATPDWAAAIDADDEFVSASLTDRETQVLALYASGETAERVARQLFISRETVLDHIRRIRAKYAAIDRAAPSKLDLYHRAVEDGVLPREH